MSEADTIREALYRTPNNLHALEAIRALERRAEQAERLLERTQEEPNIIWHGTHAGYVREAIREHLAATTPGEPTCPTCDQFGYIANLACSDDFHRATTPGEPPTCKGFENGCYCPRCLAHENAPVQDAILQSGTTPGEPE